MTRIQKLERIERREKRRGASVSEDVTALGMEVLTFLKTHAMLDETLQEGCWNSPDAYEMEHAGNVLVSGCIPHSCPFSSWELESYKPYRDQEARIKHDNLRSRIAAVIRENRSNMRQSSDDADF